MTLHPVENNIGIPKYKQLITAVEDAIVDKILKIGDQLPSVSQIQKENKVSRDTVLMALNELKTRGIVTSVAGKGYYVASESIEVHQKIFVLFDELNAFKEDLYNALLTSLNKHTEVDIYFHHFNNNLFQKLIFENIGKYSAYVIMPANFKNVAHIFAKLPREKTYILDQTQPDLKQYSGVYQNFEENIYTNLTKGLPLIRKYRKLNLIFSEKKQPVAMLAGFKAFCTDNNIENEIITILDTHTLLEGEVYVIPDDRNLIRVVKKIKEQGLILSKNIGIISYNDTLLKEIVEGGITTISTDFNAMGKRLAQMINNKEQVLIENEHRLILRNSL